MDSTVVCVSDQIVRPSNACKMNQCLEDQNSLKNAQPAKISPV